MTFHEFASAWFEGHRSRLRPSTVDRVRKDLEIHLVPFFGDYLVDQIGAGLIERYVADKVEERKAGDKRVTELKRALAAVEVDHAVIHSHRAKLRDARRERGLSHVSINKTLTLLRQVLSAAVRDGYLVRNPVDDVRRLKATPKAQPFLQLDQVEPLLKVTQARDRPCSSRSHGGAADRRGAAAPLARCRLAPDRDAPLLPRLDRPFDTATLRPFDPARRVPRPGDRQPRRIGQEARSRFTSDDDLVFPTSEGWHQNPSNFRTRVLTGDRAGEHSTCSLLIAQGEDLSTVAAQMRHADLNTTLRVYTHVMKHRREGVAQWLDEALWGLWWSRRCLSRL